VILSTRLGGVLGASILSELLISGFCLLLNPSGDLLVSLRLAEN